MVTLFRKSIAHPALAIGSALLWGIIEFIALQRARRDSART
jgi:hypothetical protein